MDIKDIQLKLRNFAADRDWEKFHSPKNLSMALAAEAAELLEIFQWVSEEKSYTIAKDSKEDLLAIQEEIADVFIYLARLADKLDIDIEAAVHEKIRLNAEKYPVDLSNGNATKYNRRIT